MKNRTIDAEGYERRTRQIGSIRCRCGLSVKMSQDTEAWVKASKAIRPIKWRHSEYGPPSGFCDCGYAYCGMPDGRVVRLDCREKTIGRSVEV